MDRLSFMTDHACGMCCLVHLAVAICLLPLPLRSLGRTVFVACARPLSAAAGNAADADEEANDEQQRKRAPHFDLSPPSSLQVTLVSLT